MKITNILNSNYSQIATVSWKRGIKLLLQEKVIVIEYYGDFVNSCGGVPMRVPRTVVLKKYVHLPSRIYRPNRRNIFLRDEYTCRYCAKSLETHELSLDHVLPKSRGGKETWENLVTACKVCNCKKGDRTPEEANMRIL
jgi:5-methylcytosine-specific restriction endonuclease McrA